MDIFEPALYNWRKHPLFIQKVTIAPHLSKMISTRCASHEALGNYVFELLQPLKMKLRSIRNTADGVDFPVISVAVVAPILPLAFVYCPDCFTLQIPLRVSEQP